MARGGLPRGPGTVLPTESNVTSAGTRSRGASRAVAAVAVLAAAAALGFYARTPHAFQRVWIPLVGMASGARVEATSGHLSWSGTLRAEDLSWRSPGVAIDLDELDLAVEPLSLLPGRTLRVRSLRLAGGDIRVRASPAGQDGTEEHGLSPADLALPRIDNARVDGITLSLARGEGTFRAGPLHLGARGLGAPGPGRLAIAAPFALDAPGAPARNGSLRATVTLGGISGTSRSYAADARIVLDPEGGEGVVPTRIELRSDGKAVAPGRLRFRSLALDASRGGAQIASLALSGASEGGALELSGTLRSPSPEALAALAGLPLGPLLGAGSALSAELAVAREAGGALRGEATLRLRELSLARSGDEAPAALRIEAALAWKEGLLSVTEATATPLAADGAALGSLGVEGRLALGSPSPSRLEIEVRGLSLAPWLAALGAPVAGSGALSTSGELRYDARAEGDASLHGEIRVTLPAPAGESAGVEYTLRPALGFGDPALRGRVEIAGLAADGSADGLAELALSLDTAATPSALDLDATVRSLDLTPLRFLWDGESQAGGPPDADPAPSDAPLAVDLEVKLGTVRLGELVAGDGSLELVREAGALSLHLAPTQLAGGAASFSFERGPAVEGERLALTVDARGVRLAPLLSALALDPDGRLRGALTVETQIEGTPTAGALFAGAHGRLRFALADGELAKSRVQDVIAKETALPEFRLIRFDHAEGDYPIRDGRLEVHGLRLDGPLVHLAVRGEVAADGVWLRINPRIGPNLAERVPTHLARYLADTVGGALALPLVVDVAGPYGAIGVRTRPAPPSLLGSLYDGVDGLARLAVEWRASDGEAAASAPASGAAR